MTTQKPDSDIINSLRALLLEGTASTQEEIGHNLQTQGYDINQSKISRLLRKLGAVKAENERGEIVYRLPKEPAPPTKTSYLHQMVSSINANETTIVIQTTPGAASVVARILDYSQQKSHILATLAGDDAILVLPKSIKEIDKTRREIEKLLFP